jgi:hypothetical protein
MHIDWPARLKDLGTFDDKWFEDRWPGLPDDFDFKYFNLAPEDQRMDDWFQGNETIRIAGMHPEKKGIFITTAGPEMQAVYPAARRRYRAVH